MASCEKCWADAFDYGMSDQTENYRRLVKERNCTPEEQAGEDATKCLECNLISVHQYVRVCMNKDCAIFGKKLLKEGE